MFRALPLALTLGGLALSSASGQAQELSRYRTFGLGMTVAAVTEEVALPKTAVRLIHQRPELIQELEWFPPQGVAGAPEAVRMVSFAFCNDRLYQVTVAYHRQRIEGLTAEDLVEVISRTYGTPVLVSSGIGTTGTAGFEEGNDRTVVTQWGDAQYSVRLFQNRYPTGFELLLVARQSENLARAARLEASRLDLLEAPQLEVDRKRKQVEDDRAKAEKARLANKAVFRF